MTKTIQEFFKLGMDRDLPDILPLSPEGDIVLNVGAGNKIIPDTITLDRPGWEAETYKLPYGDEIVAGIHAYHFLEHLHDPIRMLAEFQRVLRPGGVVQICVPYYSSNMAHQDLDHKKFYTETTWKTLFNNPYYDTTNQLKVEWKFDIGFNLICGIVERNLCLLTQLIKRG